MPSSTHKTSATPAIDVPGYQLGTIIGRGAESVVYRAARDGQKYAVKVLKGTDVEAGLRFRQEAAALARLNHLGLVKVIETGEAEGNSYLVMELVEGETLATVLDKGPISEAQCLQLARRLAGALSEVHRHGLVHRDLKPSNIVVTHEGKAKIIDFGFVARAQAEDEAPEDQLVGTFLYAPPEQTGMLRRPVDGRSDLYALGCVLFECLTGRPPFEADSVAELLKLHTAVKPPTVKELKAGVSTFLSDVVDKLLSKDPDDRYQSALGLLADLEELPALEKSRAAGADIALGKKDLQLRLAAEVQMVGRDQELDRLRQLWARTREGNGALVQIEGEPGMGKTRLAKELLERAQEHDALVLMGKAQKAEITPFGPLREAIDGHLARVNRLPKSERESHLEHIRSAAGDAAGLVKRLTRGLGRLFSDVADIPSMVQAEEDQRRFCDRVAGFLTDLSREKGFLLLLIDDVQWADEGTIEVLTRLKDDALSNPLLVVTTARNDQESQSALDSVVEKLGFDASGRIVLEPLEPDGVRELCVAHLGGKSLEESMVSKLSTRSGGNPFALGEYIRSLLDQGLLRPTLEGWVTEEDRFASVELPRDVIQLVVSRISNLDDDAVTVLRTAAVSGFSFDQEVLVGALKSDDGLVRRGLAQALQAHLVEHLEEDRYQFVHDRVAEALLSDLDDDELKDIHQALAESIDERMAEGPQKVLSLARHFAGGHAEDHQERVYETSLESGRLALESHSNELAFEHLDRAHKFARRVELSLQQKAEIDEYLGEACARTGRIELAHEHFETALGNLESPEDKARIYSLRAEAYAAEDLCDKAWEELREGLRAFGVRYPKGRFLTILYILLLWFGAVSRVRTGIGFGKARGRKRERLEALTRLISNGAIVTYYLEDPLPMVFVVICMLYHTQGLGVHPQTAWAISTYGSIPAILLGRGNLAKLHTQRALAMARQLGDAEMIGICGMNESMRVALCENPQAGRKLFLEIYPHARRFCRNFYALLASAIVPWTFTIQGRLREAAEAWLRYSRESERISAVHEVTSSLHTHLILRTALETNNDLKDQIDKLERHDDNPSAAMNGKKIFRMVDRLELGEELEKEHFLHVSRRSEQNTINQCFHVYMGYGRADQVHLARGAERKRALKALKKHVRMLMLPPYYMSFLLLFRPHLYALRAAAARESGKVRKVLRLLKKAEDLSIRIDSPMPLWATHRERARLFTQRGDEDSARREALKALEIAVEQSWVNRIEQLREEFQIDLDVEQLEEKTRADSEGTSKTEALTAQRYVDALLQVSLASSSSLDHDEQCRAALDALVRVLGAERAFLFLAHGDKPLEMQAGRDSHGEDLLPLIGFSSTVVQKVHESGEHMIVTGTDEGEALGSESAVAHELRSIMAAPLVLRDETMGVVYVDSRMAKGLFTSEHVDILRAISSHIAIAVDTARRAREQNEELQRQVEERTHKLRELNATLEKQVVDQTSTLERSRELQRFLPPQVARAVLDGEQLLERRKRVITAFRLQLQGFGRVAEQVDADELSAMLNSYLAQITDAAMEHGATVSRFQRDAISGFIGAPTSEGECEDAQRCAAMALELWERATDVCERWRDLLESEPPRPAMVLSTGETIVGSFGSPRRMEYTAIGGPVDETRKLVGQLNAGQLLCTYTTWAHIESEYEATSFQHTGSNTTLHQIVGSPEPTVVELDETRPARELDHREIGESASLEPPTLKPGVVIANRFELISKLGEGGMGTVFKARDNKLDEEVALKLIRGDLRDDRDSRRRLRREVKLARLVSHRNVARIFDLGEWAGGELISMELVRGQPLAQRLEGRLLELDEALDVLGQLCDGLAAAHAAGVIHRDLKPSNIIAEPSGRIVILDFGIAKWLSGQSQTVTRGSSGTPHYMAPEQFLGERISAQTDLYALGVVGYELLTGSVPFRAENAVALALKHADERPLDPLDMRPELPPRLGAVILRCLEKRPRDRFASAAEIRALLS